jgi:hypothetical protein
MAGAALADASGLASPRRSWRRATYTCTPASRDESASLVKTIVQFRRYPSHAFRSMAASTVPTIITIISPRLSHRFRAIEFANVINAYLPVQPCQGLLTFVQDFLDAFLVVLMALRNSKLHEDLYAS